MHSGYKSLQKLASVCELSQKIFLPSHSESSLQVSGGNVQGRSFYFTLHWKSNSFVSWLLIGSLPLNIPLFSVSHGLCLLSAVTLTQFHQVQQLSSRWKLAPVLCLLLRVPAFAYFFFAFKSFLEFASSSLHVHYHTGQKEKGFFSQKK